MSDPLEQLMALCSAHHRKLEVMGMCIPLVEKLAAEGDSLARYLLGQLDQANTVLQSENIAGHELVDGDDG